jgi:hypothetical protein
MKDYVILVYSTDAQGMFQALIDDANTFNVPITLLGWGEQWVGYRQKIEAILAFVRTLPPETIVISLDAYDTKMARHPQGSIDVFKELNVDICFSSDRTAFAPVDLMMRSVFKNTCSDVKLKYINAGMYMGYAGAIANLLTHVMYVHPKENDDQLMINLECERLSTMFNIHVDQSKIIFNNIHVSQMFTNIASKSCSSYFIGYPGTGGSTTFEPMIFMSRLKRDFADYSKMIMKNNGIPLARCAILFLLIWVVYLYCRIQKYRKGNKCFYTPNK